MVPSRGCSSQFLADKRSQRNKRVIPEVHVNL